MILEGFEIEDWSCIKRLSVSGLPASGVTVICGPNRRGKSSIVQALRACLMDYSSTTTALKSWYPRATGEKPVVSVTFRTGGTTYRIRKHFGSSKSELASQTAAGQWKVESTSAAEAHERTCGLVGGSDSYKGLQQLLWLTQAEFKLPDAKKFDAGTQSQLRGILGVLQTPLDDRFIERVKKNWSTWHSGQRKAGKPAALKENCSLADNLKHLAAGQKELGESEARFAEIEGLLGKAEDLERAIALLNQQLATQQRELAQRQEEHQRCQARIRAREQAEQSFAAAENTLAAALARMQERAAAAGRLLEAEKATAPAADDVAALNQRLKERTEELEQQRKQLAKERERRRELQRRAAEVTSALRALDDTDALLAARDVLQRATDMAQAIAASEEHLRANPVPDPAGLAGLQDNRRQVARLKAELDAASMRLVLTPRAGAAAVHLCLDGGPDVELPGECAEYSPRRKAELAIDGWGRIEVQRGTAQGDLDQLEDQLRRLEEEFAAAVAPLGIAGSDPQALDILIRRDAEGQHKSEELSRAQKLLKKIAPQGLAPLQANVRQFETRLNARAASAAHREALPADRNKLHELDGELREQAEAIDKEIDRLEAKVKAAEKQLDRVRQDEITAKTRLAACEATVKNRRDELSRLPGEEQLCQEHQAAGEAVRAAQNTLQQTELTRDELTIGDRLLATKEAVKAVESQIGENTRKLDVIKGRLLEAEGLHARRSAVAARVDELTRLTERESLERDAVDRLYALFEECKEKQLGALLGPIHDRVLGWMRVLDIGDYKALRFSDAFLPDKLLTRDETAEFSVDEESTGAQEMIGMLVRLALGSVLSANGEPAVAILDDPLTHCDAGRLNKMRLILRRAAEGDPTLHPPAGPLQVLIFTCHPEFFRDEQARVIDLEDPDVMSRLLV